MSAPRPQVVVFARRPVLGEVKTRLAAVIDAGAALDAYAELLAGVMERLSRRADAFDVVVAVTPDAASQHPDLWPPGAVLRPQGAGDLGRRIERALAQASPARPVAVVGSDIPGLDRPQVQALLAGLDDADLSLGPAPDGGYWGVAARRALPPGALDGVRWSSAHARADTAAAAGRAGLSAAVIDLWLEDVDDLASYRRWRGG